MAGKYKQIIRAFYNEPWAIMPEKFDEMREFLAAKRSGVMWSTDEIQARIGDRPTARATDPGSAVAVLDLFGVMSQRLSMMEDISGGMSTERVGKAFDSAVADDAVKHIVLNIDSPGGSVFGTGELFDKIFAARGIKPITSVINSTAGSGAFWVSVAADEVVITPGGWQGSHGVIWEHHDTTGMDEQDGVTRTFITAGEFKGEGRGGPLTDSEKDGRQILVDKMFAKFTAGLAAGRGVSTETVLANFGRGRMLLAQDAVNANMADRIGTLDSVLSEIGVSSTQSVAQQSTPGFSLKGSKLMEPKLYKALVAMGMAPLASEAQATETLDHFFAARGTEKPEAVADQIAALAGKPEPAAAVATVEHTLEPVQSATTLTMSPAVSGTEILAAVRIASSLDADTKVELQNTLMAASEAGTLTHATMMKTLQDKVAEATASVGATINVIAEERDKFSAAATDAILSRAWSGQMPTTVYDADSGMDVDWKPDRRDHQLANMPNLAKMCAVQSGIPRDQVDRMTNIDAARLAMGADPRDCGLRLASDGPVFNVSGLFSNLLLDASNKMLRRSYTEAPTTYQRWMKQGPSVPDFKDVNKIIAGEIPDPKAIPENGQFEEQTISDGKETYKLVTWGGVWSQSWQSVVNDDLSSFTEIPMKQGAAMARKWNKLAYNILKDNSTLATTGGALFNTTAVTTATGHANLVTSGAVPSVATLNTGFASMSIQPGLDTDATRGTVLGIEPRWIIAAPALRGTILELLGSTANPAKGGSAAGSSGVVNIWQNGLEPIIDAQLSTAAGGTDASWYLAADTSVIDTIEYAFLQGLETPRFEQQIVFDRLGMRQRVYQSFVVKALDFRGLFNNDGA